YEDLTATENLAFFGKLYGLKSAHLKSRIETCIDFAGLADRKHDRVSTYSGGMKRRLNMAVAIIHEPQLVVFDEPTVGVDPQSRNHIFDCIERLKREGRTILYTTHYMEEAQRLCDRVAIMDKGKILDVDTVDALLLRHGGLSLLEVQVDDAEVSRVSDMGTMKNGSLAVRSDDPLALVLRLHERGVAFRSLSVRRPDLEAVFLNLTGRRLRDE
ncbi:MAG TPA: ABC transporter ATP-binding protein, partial [Planctomycetota bacterium]|nr:ABC transporter ATP-binding protein [Planctomycetota bacterium]